MTTLIFLTTKIECKNKIIQSNIVERRINLSLSEISINLINNIGFPSFVSELISKSPSLHHFVENIVEIITEEIQEAIPLVFFPKTRQNSAEKNKVAEANFKKKSRIPV